MLLKLSAGERTDLSDERSSVGTVGLCPWLLERVPEPEDLRTYYSSHSFPNLNFVVALLGQKNLLTCMR